ncbi:hypothetical protein J7K52_00560 [Candidatus Bathyarchaeota archaeon]|nr:hypothetical protein [Candidatus Bathyarchaeota archaeon]
MPMFRGVVGKKHGGRPQDGSEVRYWRLRSPTPTLQSVETIHDLLEWSPINAGEDLPQPIKMHLTIKEEEKYFRYTLARQNLPL